MARIVLVERFIYSSHGTFGVLSTGDYKCFTVERPWMQNQPSVSCIPEGVYPLIRGFYNAGGYEAFHVEPVPERTLIKIHRANYPTDVQGCIGLGKRLILDPTKGMGVYPSGEAYTDFMDCMTSIDSAELHIRSFNPTNP